MIDSTKPVRQVLVCDRFDHEAYLHLTTQKFLNVEKSATPNLHGVDLKGVNALLIRSRTPITRDILEAAKDLQVVISATSGFDHIDLDACAEWGVTVMYTPDANIESAAQLTWSLVLACVSKLIPAQKEVRGGTWNRDSIVGTELSGKTYGVIGLGRIGSRVTQIARAFGTKVVAFDPYADDEVFARNHCERLAYEEILKHSDILSFHVPRTKETRSMLNRSHFEYIHRGLILINSSRGGVISEPDLIEALENGWIGAVGLDVFEKEPLPRHSKLLNFPNAVLTPHIGANTNEAFSKASQMAATQLINFFTDGSTQDTLPPKAAWYGVVAPWDQD